MGPCPLGGWTVRVFQVTPGTVGVSSTSTQSRGNSWPAGSSTATTWAQAMDDIGAVSCQGCAIPRLCHLGSGCATLHYDMCATLCCAWLHIAVPYPTVPHGARALLTRLGGWWGAEQVATSRSHWRVSSSQHPSGDPGDRTHVSVHSCSLEHHGWLVPRTCRQVGDGGRLHIHK